MNQRYASGSRVIEAFDKCLFKYSRVPSKRSYSVRLLHVRLCTTLPKFSVNVTNSRHVIDRDTVRRDYRNTSMLRWIVSTNFLSK